jgi:selenocysteine lyase/cysteine desulfurase
MNLQEWFAPFRAHIVGQDAEFETPFGKQKLVYADWTASGRLYAPIEEKMLKEFGPFVANTHTETNICGTSMTLAYHQARQIIKDHVGANAQDCIINYGSGMTGVINKFQRILGLRIPEKWQNHLNINAEERPVIFVSHMEHHSNQTSWLETICDLEVIAPDPDGLLSLQDLQRLLQVYQNRQVKIAAITACSNVTGIETPYHQVAEIMHQNGGLCFVDFACSAPYIKIDMHPKDISMGFLDAIYFSPHKFLGGPGSAGCLIFNANLYQNRVPDNPGGGTVKWTNPWKEHQYVDTIEDREDGGTPPFLQTIRTALSIKLKEAMQIEKILQREKEMIELIFAEFDKIENLVVLARQHTHRLAVISFYIVDLHYNLAVKLLNDHFGIQVRGGCFCAGTYGHYLFEIAKEDSHAVTRQIDSGDLSNKPGAIRLSLHPTMTDSELRFIAHAIWQVAKNHYVWALDYQYDPKSNEFFHRWAEPATKVGNWFVL